MRGIRPQLPSRAEAGIEELAADFARGARGETGRQTVPCLGAEHQEDENNCVNKRGAILPFRSALYPAPCPVLPNHALSFLLDFVIYTARLALPGHVVDLRIHIVGGFADLGIRLLGP